MQLKKTRPITLGILLLFFSLITLAGHGSTQYQISTNSQKQVQEPSPLPESLFQQITTQLKNNSKLKVTFKRFELLDQNQILTKAEASLFITKISRSSLASYKSNQILEIRIIDQNTESTKIIVQIAILDAKTRNRKSELTFEI